jgi:molybdopterin synthase sulfur carrier subunit
MLNILYFASLREVLGKADESLAANQFKTVECLIQSLAERGEMWTGALLNNTNLQIAVNHDVADRTTALKAGDEVAFFPPVTGG